MEWLNSEGIKRIQEKLCGNTELLRTITIEEVNSTLKRMGKEKAPGPDKVPTEAFTHAPINIIEFVVDLFNKCISTKVIPDSWKISKLFLIHKGGKETLENYRPIALLNSIYKIFASILNNRLNNLINDKNIIHSHQSGFQRGRSTSSRIWL